MNDITGMLLKHFVTELETVVDTCDSEKSLSEDTLDKMVDLRNQLVEELDM